MRVRHVCQSEAKHVIGPSKRPDDVKEKGAVVADEVEPVDDTNCSDNCSLEGMKRVRDQSMIKGKGGRPPKQVL